jgi:hypothetical protein
MASQIALAIAVPQLLLIFNAELSTFLNEISATPTHVPSKTNDRRTVV